MAPIQVRYNGKRLRELMLEEIHRIAMRINSKLYGIPSSKKERDDILHTIHQIMYLELRRAYLSKSDLPFHEWYKEFYEDIIPPNFYDDLPFTAPAATESPPATGEIILPDWLHTGGKGL